MNKVLFNLYKKIAFLGEPEKVHDVSLSALNFIYKSYVGKILHTTNKSRETKALNLTFDNPLGLAAGFDKNGDYLDFICNVGFGFVEVGTLTPLPQEGNPKPRIFRVTKDEAIINHLGFNNKGIDYALEKIKKYNRNIPIGINIGKNAATPINNAFQDYEYCLRKAYAIADYITLNISSPNTEQLRDLQLGEKINEFLYSIKTLHDNLNKVYKKYTPLVIKISPDMNKLEIEELTELIKKYEIDGVICTNTTIDKSSLSTEHRNIQGGLSGKPLFSRANNTLKIVSKNISDKTVVIAAGGINSSDSARVKFDNGAQLLQIYTGLVYQGPALLREILKNN